MIYFVREVLSNVKERPKTEQKIYTQLYRQQLFLYL